MADSLGREKGGLSAEQGRPGRKRDFSDDEKTNFFEDYWFDGFRGRRAKTETRCNVRMQKSTVHDKGTWW